MINCIVSSKLNAFLQLVPRRSCNNRAPIEFGNLDSKDSHSRAPAHNQDKLSWFDFCAANQHVPRSHECHRGCGCLLVAYAFRDFYCVDFGQVRYLTVSTPQRTGFKTPNLAFFAIKFPARRTIFADSAGHVSMGDNPVPDFDFRDVLSNCNYISCHIRAGNVR